MMNGELLEGASGLKLYVLSYVHIVEAWKMVTLSAITSVSITIYC
jgi:hypothetical protein